MQRIADTVVSATGWARRLIALGAGAVGALALAPLNVGPALVVTMVVAVWLIDGCGGEEAADTRWLRPGWRALRRAFGAGWWLGFGYFVAGFWWLSAAFLIDPEFVWELPIGVLGVPALLAVFTGLGFAAARLLWVAGAARVLALAVGLGLLEWGRGHLFTGFPWNPFGMGLGGTLVTAQLAALIGLDGLTFVTVALFAAPATLVDRRRDGRTAWRPTAIAAGVAGAILLFGGLRLAQPEPGDMPDVVVRIMQPGLRPDRAFSYENKDEIVSRYIELSQAEDGAKHIALADVTLLVWPESAFPFVLTREPDELARIGAALPPRTTLVTGAAREEEIPARAGAPAHSDYYNTMDVIARGGRIVQGYDKVHLVPFGEYLPFSALLGRMGLRNFVSTPGGFEPGSERHNLRIPGMPPASPLICYEAIFPGAVLPPSGRRPGFLLNVTNDGWFGMTTGPRQHLAQARLRTIEEGLPMVRAAATGVSAFIDPYGRLLGTLPLGAEGILDHGLPKAIAPPIAARWGMVPFWILWFGSCLLLAALGRRRDSKA